MKLFTYLLFINILVFSIISCAKETYVIPATAEIANVVNTSDSTATAYIKLILASNAIKDSMFMTMDTLYQYQSTIYKVKLNTVYPYTDTVYLTGLKMKRTYMLNLFFVGYYNIENVNYAWQTFEMGKIYTFVSDSLPTDTAKNFQHSMAKRIMR